MSNLSVTTGFDVSAALQLDLSTKDLMYTSPCGHQAKKEECKPSAKTKTNTNIMKQKKIKLKYHCAICNYYGKSKKGITRHNNSKTHLKKSGRKGSGRTCVECNICKATAMSDLTKCPLCSYSSSNMTGLKLHMNIHNTGRPFKCAYCEYTAQNVTDLIQHYKTVEKFMCTNTGCVFVTHVKSQLLEHRTVCRWK